MVKALREAKVNTSWISPNLVYEDALSAFVDSILTKHAQNKFFEDFYQFQNMTAACGIFNSLSQTLLKITSPGIPDIYQGNELWDFSLVDPDNRRPVDFGVRKTVLAEIVKNEATIGLLEAARHLVDSRSDGRIKQHLTYKALTFRRNNRELFESGNYLPLAVTGALAEHICAFERSLDDSSILVIVPRFCSRLIADSSGVPLGQETWRDTRIMLPHGSAACSYRNIFTGEIVQTDQQMTLAVSDILSVFPVALLESSEETTNL
jgi:(1->4)-alpha-D-glucan 1-alpha-D-glucosylmutase